MGSNQMDPLIGWTTGPCFILDGGSLGVLLLVIMKLNTVASVVKLTYSNNQTPCLTVLLVLEKFLKTKFRVNQVKYDLSININVS